jgi:transposase
MSKANRKRYSAEFKAKVAIEAIKGEKTVTEIGAKFGVHPNLVGQWKKHATDGMSGVFEGKIEASGSAQEAQIKELHAKIGQLIVERDFLARAFGR